MLSSPRITIACVAEPSEPSISEAIDLFSSLRFLGGSISTSPGVVFVVGPISDGIANRFALLGVQIYIVDRFDDRCPHANKLHMIHPQPDTDYLIALDTDVVIAGDFSSHISGKSILAKIVDQDPLTLDLWSQLFSSFNLPLPLPRFLTSFHNAETIPYFNSGVLFIPNDLSAPLNTAWSKATRELLDRYPQLPELSPHRFFTDQFALSIALHAANLPYRALPIELNFPSHMPLHHATNADTLTPLLIHHHHRRTAQGELDECAYHGPNQVIGRVNEALHRTPSLDSTLSERVGTNNERFDNRDFWDARYFNNPSLGSGIGSRGDHSVYKRRIVQKFIDELPGTSVLDVGCGDLEIFLGVNFHGNYHGIDVSQVIIDRNKSSYRDKHFTCLDFVTAENIGTVSADGVVCFDVLIHQHRFGDYERLVERLVRAAGRRGLVSGYVSRPRPFFRSEITCYHEPLTVTLKRFGASDIKIIGAYRDTNIISFSVPHND